MAGDVKAAGDMVAQFTDIAARSRRPQNAGEGAPAAANNPVAAQTPAATGTQRDAVAFTDTANTLRQAERALENEPVVDNERVERVRTAVADGSYEINPQRIANKLVDMESSLSGGKN